MNEGLPPSPGLFVVDLKLFATYIVAQYQTIELLSRGLLFHPIKTGEYTNIVKVT